ncbi:MAG: hypothetical protein KBA66_19985 [Leptospiraceae bacterium]|nr:hypothetical protein [Leptospiraceae bacterium]
MDKPKQNIVFQNSKVEGIQLGDGNSMHNNFGVSKPEKGQEEFSKDLLYVCTELQSKILSIVRGEDHYNAWVTTMLECKGYNIADQTRDGLSGSDNPKQPGELDLKYRSHDNTAVSVLEAFLLGDSFDKQNITKHILKIFKYDLNGLKVNYVLVYYEGKDFLNDWKRYQEHLKNIDYGSFKINSISPQEENNTNYAEIKNCSIQLIREDSEIEIRHLFIKLEKFKQV